MAFQLAVDESDDWNVNAKEDDPSIFFDFGLDSSPNVVNNDITTDSDAPTTSEVGSESNETIADRSSIVVPTTSTSSTSRSPLPSSPLKHPICENVVVSPRSLSPAPSLGNVSHTSSSMRSSTVGDFERLTKQHAKLKNAYDQMLNDRHRTPSIEETMRRMVRGDQTSLTCYKSLPEKMELLTAAVETGHDTVIIMVVLHLRHTLCDNIFMQILHSCPSAANHYVAHLRDLEEWKRAVNVLESLNRFADSAHVSFVHCTSATDAQERRTRLKEFAVDKRSDDPVNKYVELIDTQLALDTIDDKAQARGDARFMAMPKRSALIGQSTLTTLYYICLYHYDDKTVNKERFREFQQLVDGQYAWSAVKALCRHKRWPDIQSLLHRRSLLGVSKVYLPMPCAQLVHLLHRHDAPADLLSQYLPLVVDVAERCTLAESVDCHRVVVDCLVAQKDRQALIEFTARLMDRSKEKYYAQAALANADTRWMN